MCRRALRSLIENVTRLFAGMDVGIEMGPQQVWAQCSSLAFDYSVWEIWGALLHGGRLVVVPETGDAAHRRICTPSGRRARRTC